MLDFKFLNDRYVKGKDKVNAFLSEKHRMMAVETLHMGHSTIVEMQGAMGPDGFLDSLIERRSTNNQYESDPLELMVGAKAYDPGV